MPGFEFCYTFSRISHVFSAKFAFLKLHERSCKEFADRLAQNVQSGWGWGEGAHLFCSGGSENGTIVLQ
jgi:hypothetical protein